MPDVVVPEAERLRLAVLVHLPLADETGLAPETAAELDDRERTTLHAVPAVVATSHWAAGRLVAHHGLAADRVHVAAPGADKEPAAHGTDGVRRLLCVAAVTPRKGQLRLVEALAAVDDRSWTCDLRGRGRPGPRVRGQVRQRIDQHGLGDRVRLVGPQAGAELAASYAAADLFVLTSYAETYGMVVTEALARGIPVLATAVGGLPEAVGHAPDGSVPGLLVPSDDPAALPAALHRWFGEPDLRHRLTAAARERRTALDGWETTARSLAAVLEQLRPEPEGRMNTTETPRYAPEWLQLREPVDAAARAAELLAPLQAHLSGREAAESVIHDLGCGTGSMGRWLAPRLGGAQHWILHDHDADLLELAAAHTPRTAADDSAVTVETSRSDIALMTAELLAGASLVTASALLDVLTADEVDALAAACAGAGCPALFALSVLGKVELTPAEPLDEEIAEAFNAHQRRGGLLGPDAVTVAAEAFGRHGATVALHASPWQLGAGESALTAEWLRGWVGAAIEQRPELAPEAERYLHRRLAACAAGELQVVVHHSDLLALPGTAGGATLPGATGGAS